MAGAGGSRDEAFDLAKGIGIIAVVGLHLSNRSARFFHEEYSRSWWALKWINLFLNFCVPLFLFISAVLLARSVARQERPNWGRFAWRRTKSVLFPLILWSGIYWGLRTLIRQDPKYHDPAYWSAIGDRLFDLAFGKAEFHLYFLSVLGQLCILFPLLVLLLRGRRRGQPVHPAYFLGVFLIAILVQTGVVLIQKQVEFKFPASTVFWYMSTILPGVWIGLNWESWPAVRRIAVPLGGLLAIGGFTLLASEMSSALQKLPANGTVINASTWAFALGMCLIILAALSRWMERAASDRSGRFARVPLRKLGEMSLQIYLIHPMVMQGLSQFPNRLRSLPVPSFWFFFLTLVFTFAIALILDRIPYVNTILFGRDTPRKPSEKSASSNAETETANPATTGGV